MRNRGVDIQGFPGNTTTFVWPKRSQRAHIVGAVSQFDQYHPDVLHHRHHHFAKVFSLGFLFVRKRQFVQLTDPFDQFGDRIAKGLGQVFFAVMRVFNDIVQQGGHQGFMVKMHIRQNSSHRHRVSNIRIATGAHLAIMRFMSKNKGFLHQVHTLWRQVV